MKEKRENKIFFLYLIGWCLINFLSLDKFPFYHSDEIWLAGLTREMLDRGSLQVTEPFFDIFPCTVHGLRILYHFFNGMILKVFGFTPVSIRLLPLLSGVLALWGFFRLLKKIGFSGKLSFLGGFLLSLDIQFLYASHFGRQEMLLVLFSLAGLNLFFSDRILWAGVVTGLSAGIHPNAFIIAWPVILLLFFDILSGKKRVREGLLFLLTAGGIGGIFIFLSLILNPHFLQEYLDFGYSVGLRTGFFDRVTDFIPFWRKLYYQVSGTYYTPPIKGQLIFLGLLLGAGGLLLVRPPSAVVGGTLQLNRKAMRTAVISGFGTALGLLLLGKYSQPSVIFFFPSLYILLTLLLSSFFSKKNKERGGFRLYRGAVLLGLSLFVLVNLFHTVQASRKEGGSFCEYNGSVESLIPPGSFVLANINAGLALKESQYYDWRNLSVLPRDIDLGVYLASRGINYILYPDELDYIYSSRPVWNVMYGNLYPWYDELQRVLADEFELVGAFNSPGYAMRITSLRYRDDWQVKVYKLRFSSIKE